MTLDEAARAYAELAAQAAQLESLREFTLLRAVQSQLHEARDAVLTASRLEREG